MLRFVHKRKAEEILPTTIKPVVVEPVVEETAVENTAVEKIQKVKKNKKEKINEEQNMDFETIKPLEAELAPEQKVKKIKTDRGLIERAESSKTIITENNQQLLLG